MILTHILLYMVVIQQKSLRIHLVPKGTTASKTLIKGQRESPILSILEDAVVDEEEEYYRVEAILDSRPLGVIRLDHVCNHYQRN